MNAQNNKKNKWEKFESIEKEKSTGFIGEP
jgi:hypothetical protein